MLLEQDGKVKPAYFEVPFGMGAEKSQAGIGSMEALHIPCLQGIVSSCGARSTALIAMGRGHYQVWDYKTGST